MVCVYRANIHPIPILHRTPSRTHTHASHTHTHTGGVHARVDSAQSHMRLVDPASLFYSGGMFATTIRAIERLCRPRLVNVCQRSERHANKVLRRSASTPNNSLDFKTGCPGAPLVTSTRISLLATAAEDKKDRRFLKHETWTRRLNVKVALLLLLYLGVWSTSRSQ